jgi:hypothetical protein
MRKSMAFLLFSLTIIAVPAFADPMTDAEALARFDAAAVHEFRRTLEDIIDMHSDVVAASGASELAAATARRKKVVRELGDADVARLMATGVDLSELRAQTAGLHELVFRGEPASQLVGTNSTGFPSAPYSFCGVTRRSTTGMLVAQITLEAAQNVWSIASRACDQVVVAAGFGGNGSAACIIVDEVLFAAQTTYNAFVYCDANIDSAEILGSYNRLEHLHGDVEDAKASILSNAGTNREAVVADARVNRTAVVSNDNVNKDAIVANDNANRTIIVNATNSGRDAIIANDNANRDTVVANANDNRDKVITNDNANRDTLITELRAIGCDVIRLLNTPEGQRGSVLTSCSGQPGYPYNFPQKKGSNVVASGTSLRVPEPQTPIARGAGTVSIETHLLESRLIPSYYLPASRGGMIEHIRDLVHQTLGAQADLGIAVAETASARELAKNADTLLDHEKFVDAYRAYAAAYQALVPKN